VNSAIDKLVHQRDEVIDLLAAYGASDLLCYRATGPEGLITRQMLGWDPLLGWSALELAAPLVVTAGIVPVAQPVESLVRLKATVASFDAFQLAAFHDFVAITGSLILGIAITHGRLSAAEAFALSRIDESWQAEFWGVDEDAAALEAAKQRALLEAEQFYALCR
jgi:chaperone required for assembly of F1-ATPase